VTDQAAVAAAVPISAVDLDANWFFWDTFGFQNSLGGAAGEISFEERVMDSKAMRRIDQPDNASIIMAVSTTFGGITGDLLYRTRGRLLIKGD